MSSTTSSSSSASVSSGGAAAPQSTLPVLAVRRSEVTYPTGNKSFSVMQAFPAAISAEEADPFLMCDFFGPTKSTGVESDPDRFPVAWHPHRGMDIATYMVQGVGRHADSMGNRETFESPGMQFCSVGSGIEHAEGGGTPAGADMAGFQIWVNVPSARKMDAPRYGTIGPAELPLLAFDGNVSVRPLAGELGGRAGPFSTVQPLLMADVTLPPGQAVTLPVRADFETAIAFVFRGGARVNGAAAGRNEVVLLDGSDAAGGRGLELAAAGPDGASVMVFCGKRLNQPIAWHGPFVLTTQAEVRATIQEYQRGAFPPVRAPFDYKTLAAFPADHAARRASKLTAELAATLSVKELKQALAARGVALAGMSEKAELVAALLAAE